MGVHGCVCVRERNGRWVCMVVCACVCVCVRGKVGWGVGEGKSLFQLDSYESVMHVIKLCCFDYPQNEFCFLV